jgi:hypothetical protein
MQRKIISKLLFIINFCSKTRTKPKPSSKIKTEFYENNSFWGKKKKSRVGGLTSSLPFQTRLLRIGTRIRSDFQNLVESILDKTLKRVGRVSKMTGPALGKYPLAFLLLANSLPNFDLRNMSLTYAKEFSWKKKTAQIHHISGNFFFQITRFSFDKFQ